MARKREFLLLGLLLSGLLALPAGCAPKPLGTPLALTAFTWRHRGTDSAQGYSYSAERTEEGTRLLLSLYAGSRELDMLVEEDVLAELGALAAEHRLDRWDGFDKRSRRALDGTGFSLTMVTAEGKLVEANGSNAFPRGYAEAKAAIEAVFAPYVDDAAPCA